MDEKEVVDKKDLLRNLPSVHEVLNSEASHRLMEQVPRPVFIEGVRIALDKVRQQILKGDEMHVPTTEEIVGLAQTAIQFDVMPTMLRAINATGIIVHTGLGRSLLAEVAIKRIAEVARYPCALEIDEVTGERRFRDFRVEKLLCLLTNAESATVVNNNAAAVLLILNTLADGKEVIISRGELVEIGGSFRIPEILRKSGAILVEVGTTNKTRISDYEQAINERTAVLLKVHQSNFRIFGFTEQVLSEELVELGKKTNIPVVQDLGSGALIDVSKAGIEKEPLVQQSVKAGVDLICFSGDKLLGGPQAGIIVGRKNLVAQLRKNPLYRALRCDKLTFASLEATLLCYFDEKQTWQEIPTLRQIGLTESEVKKRAKAVIKLLQKLGIPIEAVKLQRSSSQVGGGALPDQFLPTWCVVMSPKENDSAETLAHRLRVGKPPVFCRIQHDVICFDLRTVLPDELEILAESIAKAWFKL